VPVRALGATGLVLALLLAGPGQADGPRGLPELVPAASWIVLAEVTGSSEFSEAALVVHHVEVLDSLWGSPPAEVRVLEEQPSLPPLLEPGQRVLLLLERVPAHSFYRENLPPGRYVSPVDGRRGVIVLGEEHDALARRLVASYARGARGEDDRPELMRGALRSGHARFVAEALGEWERRTDLAQEFSRKDLEAARACLQDARLGEPLKLRLIRLLGDRKLRRARTLLRQLEPSSPRIATARAEALAQLGEAPDPAQAEALLSHPDAEVRRLGVRQLEATAPGEGVGRLEALALYDRDKSVRIAAIGALGRAGGEPAAEVLEETFHSRDPDLRIASAHAFRSMGGALAQGALEDLVLRGRSYEVQRYALMLLLLEGAPHEGERIERIREEHKDDRIRRLLDEGLQSPEHPGMGPR